LLGEWAKWQREFNDNKLILDGDKATIEKEVWRFFTYTFVHSGWQHLIGKKSYFFSNVIARVGNMMMQLIVGSLLEIVHGTIRIMVIYVIGKLSCKYVLKISFA
jgi:membrane associated rhomboid family serine protease